MQEETGTRDRITEVLAKAWLVCDPNRGCVDPDAVDPGLGMGPGNSYEGKPRWHWFIDRAEAMRDYLSENGLVIRPKDKS
jgi:hypothetical protein